MIVVNVIPGVSWKQGQWTNEEVEILQSNITNYCKVGTQHVVLGDRTFCTKVMYEKIWRHLVKDMYTVYFDMS